MKKMLAIAICALGVLGVASTISMAASITSGQSDIPGMDVHHGCSPATTPCK